MRRRKILMACSNYWNSPFQVGSHHLARSFVKAGWDVAYFSDPISPFHLLAGVNDGLRERFVSYKKFGGQNVGEHVWDHVPGAIFTPHNKVFLRSNWVYKNWWRLAVPSLKSISKKIGFADVDLIYVDSIIYYFWLKLIKHKKAIFRLADNNSGFDKFTPSAKVLSECLAREVDLVTYSAKSLQNYAVSLKPKAAYYLPNGIDLAHFTTGEITMPEELKLIPKPIAIYVGAIEYWFDFELLNLATRSLPHVNFVIIGPKQAAAAKLEPRENLHLLGTKSFKDLPPYLHNSDIGIIPFNVKKYPILVNNINPLKIYEYLACGLAVVSVEWEELKSLGLPVDLSKTSAEFVQAVSSAAKNTKRSAKENILPLLEKMDWDYRAEELLKVLNIG